MSAVKRNPADIDAMELPQPSWVAPRRRLAMRLDLRRIMILLVYFAIGSTFARRVSLGGDPLASAALGFWIGVGICYLGVWVAVRLRRSTYVGWILFVIGYVTAGASVLGPLVVPSVPIVIGVIVYLHLQRRRHLQDGMAWVLAVAATRGIPMAPGVEAYGQEAGGMFAIRAHALAVLLDRGRGLAEAVDRVPGVVPWDAPLLILAGERAGRLAEALREAADTRAWRHHAVRDVFGRLGYLGAVVAAGQGIVGFVAYFILPKFEAIFKDFDIELPSSTALLISTSHALGDAGWLVAPAQFLFLLFVTVAVARGRLAGLPLVGGLFRIRQKALLLRALALVVEAGRPIEEELGLMAQRFPAGWVRRKIARATAAVRSGVSWTDALHFVRLIHAADVGVLDAAARAGNLPWALRALAEAGERRSAYRLQVGSQVAFLAAMVGLGALVLAIAVALFVPLVTLIERLAG